MQLIRSNLSTLLLLLVLAASPAHADILAILVDDADLPYDLSPSHYENSASNYANSHSNYQNSASNYNNSSSNYKNSPRNYENRPEGGRAIYTQDNQVIGYYVHADSGVINFYSYEGRRVAYLPASGSTQSVFSESGWCGLIGNLDGETVLGLTQSCMLRFLLDD